MCILRWQCNWNVCRKLNGSIEQGTDWGCSQSWYLWNSSGWQWLYNRYWAGERKLQSCWLGPGRYMERTGAWQKTGYCWICWECERCYLDDINEVWISQHCRILQYMLQIVKCNDSDCCGEMWSVWKDDFTKRFLPVKIPHTQAGPQVPSLNDEKASDNFPNLGMRVLLDKIVGIPSTLNYPYCPSLRKNLEWQVCLQCGIYYPSIRALKQHQQGAACVYDNNDDKGDSGWRQTL